MTIAHTGAQTNLAVERTPRVGDTFSVNQCKYHGALASMVNIV